MGDREKGQREGDNQWQRDYRRDWEIKRVTERETERERDHSAKYNANNSLFPWQPNTPQSCNIPRYPPPSLSHSLQRFPRSCFSRALARSYAPPPTGIFKRFFCFAPKRPVTEKYFCNWKIEHFATHRGWINFKPEFEFHSKPLSARCLILRLIWKEWPAVKYLNILRGLNLVDFTHTK